MPVRAILLCVVLAWAVAVHGAGHTVPGKRSPATGKRPAASPTLAAHAIGLPPAVREQLRKAGIGEDEVGLLAVPLDGGPPLARWNEDLPFNPASTMKLVTTHAALGLLGLDYRWGTGVYLSTLLDGDRLPGNLVLRGGGDPKFVVEDLAAFIARIRATGLRQIDGDLIIDDALYDASSRQAETIDGERSRPYNVAPFAALMNFKSTRFVFTPEDGAEALAIGLDPPLADVRVLEQVRLLPGPCRAGAAGLRITDLGDDRHAEVRVQGEYSRACGTQSVFAAILTHRQFVHGLFKAIWLASGGQWNGATRIEPGAARGEPWLIWESPRTLGEVIVDINKNSNNVMTRQLLLHLAAHTGSAPASVADGRRILRAWLAARGLDSPGLLFENGAGLSRTARMSAATQIAVLRDAAASPWSGVFLNSLPVIGVDGTMEYRLRADPVRGHGWIKTGALEGVRTIAGYLDAASGRRYAVAMLVNSPRARAGRVALDEFLRYVHISG